MGVKQALFDAMVQAPGADGPRLAYADLLVEEGDPRGEFIAVQCRLASGKLRGAALKAARAREAELLAAHREEWFGPLEKWLRERDSYVRNHVEVARGFVRHCRLVATEAADLITLFRRAPLLQSLELNGVEVHVPAALGQLESVEASGGAAASLLRALSSGQRADALHTLVVSHFGHARAVSLGALPVLRRFSFDGGVATLQLPAGLEDLASLRWSTCVTDALGAPGLHLKRLTLTNHVVDEALLGALAAHAPHLEHLVLTTCRVAQPLLRELLQWRWPQLTWLDLSNSTLKEDGAMLATLKAPKLEVLDLTNTRLKDPEVQALLASPLLEHLREISLRANRITRAAVAPVLARSHHLRLLNLKKTLVTPGDLVGLASALPGTRLSR